MQALLIDDEPAANQALGAMLRRGHPTITVIGMATNVGEGLQKILTNKPDLVFLDINLPDGKGFDLVRQLPSDQRPEIIFVTSDHNYAMQAIKVAALGYLVKPVDAAELATSIQHAEDRIRQKNSERRLQALLANLDATSNAQQQISIPSDQGVAFVRAGDILYCEGVNGYTSIKTRNGKQHLSSYSIGEYRKMLEPYDFRAVHRSFVVNRLHVTGWGNGGVLTLINGEQVPISRRKKEIVQRWLDL